MVSVGVSSLGYTDLVFIDPSIKTIWSYYQDMLLSHSYGDFTFQQDSAPAHRGASETVALLLAEIPDFISPLDWPPNIPDLKLVD